MSHSTTATSTYVLAKYSKSYPTSLAQQTGAETNASEWQHFTNPILRLVLDIKKGTDLESVRLRILWSMDSGDEQREVVFEDIDLLTLSCLPQPRAPKQPTQGLPLKAVYRDTVVGIRYLHPPDTSVASIYRRFQITFLSTSAVLEFIDAIRTVCPCKANPNTAPIPRPMNPPPGPILSNTNLVHPQSRGGPLAYVPSPLANSASLRYSAADTLPFSSQSLPSSSQADLRHGTYSSSPLHLDTNEARTSASSPSPAVLRQPTLSAISTRANSDGTHKHTGSGFAQIQALPTYPDLLKKTSLPKSSPPTSSAQSIPRLPTLPSSASDDEQASALLLSLRELTALYDLPPSVLEQLVGEVVREDGFVKLMENLNAMWRVKSFVDI